MASGLRDVRDVARLEVVADRQREVVERGFWGSRVSVSS